MHICWSPRQTKKSIVFFEEAPMLVSIRLIHPFLTTYASKPIKVYLIVLHNPDHVLHCLLPPVAHTSHNYCLRPRAHDRSLPERLTHLTHCNFIICMLFYQVYWLYLTPACLHCLASKECNNIRLARIQWNNRCCGISRNLRDPFELLALVWWQALQENWEEFT